MALGKLAGLGPHAHLEGILQTALIHGFWFPSFSPKLEPNSKLGKRKLSSDDFESRNKRVMTVSSSTIHLDMSSKARNVLT